MTTEERLRSLLEAAEPGPPWIRKWQSLVVHGIAGDGVLERQENVDLAVAAVNALPKLLAVVAAARDVEVQRAVAGSGLVLTSVMGMDRLRAALAALDEP